MPDQTVTVTFDPTANPQFTFTPNPVTMTAAGKVILLRSGGQTWTFTNASVDDPQFTVDANSAANIQINDAWTSMGTFCYTVTVLSNGTSYTSPDPDIVNEPPSPEPVPPPKPPLTKPHTPKPQNP
jgi:hypothetical protein